MRRVTALLLAILLVSVAPGTDALADDDEVVTGDCPNTSITSGTCGTTAMMKGVHSGGDDSRDVKIPPRRCYDLGDEIPCTTEHGYWHSGYGCYIQPYDTANDPEERGEPPEGMQWVNCTMPPREGDWVEVIALPIGEAEPPPDPRRVAWQLIAEIQIRAGQIAFVPDAEIALIGLPHWMWIPDRNPHTIGPITKSATKNGYTITIDAALDRVVYDMGNGDTVTCQGAGAKGTRYLERYKLNPSPTCGYDTGYAEPGDYTITAQSFWIITWYGVGQAGTITLDFTRSVETTVAEKVSVNR